MLRVNLIYYIPLYICYVFVITLVHRGNAGTGRRGDSRFDSIFLTLDSPKTRVRLGAWIGLFQLVPPCLIIATLSV